MYVLYEICAHAHTHTPPSHVVYIFYTYTRKYDTDDV